MRCVAVIFHRALPVCVMFVQRNNFRFNAKRVYCWRRLYGPHNRSAAFMADKDLINANSHYSSCARRRRLAGMVKGIADSWPRDYRIDDALRQFGPGACDLQPTPCTFTSRLGGCVTALRGDATAAPPATRPTWPWPGPPRPSSPTAPAPGCQALHRPTCR